MGGSGSLPERADPADLRECGGSGSQGRERPALPTVRTKMVQETTFSERPLSDRRLTRYAPPMRFENIRLGFSSAWSTPFMRWQGPAAMTNSNDLAERATRAALDRAGVSWPVVELVLGQTVMQPGSFYAAPTLAARLGFEDVPGPLIAQACATSVSCLHAAAVSSVGRNGEARLVVTTDRVSNAPTLIWPNPAGSGGAPLTEHWALDNFARDPWAGGAMISTAERVAGQAGFSKEQLDEVTALRYQQYNDALKDDRAFQRRYMISVDVGTKRKPNEVSEDVGVRPTTLTDLEALKPIEPDGVVTYGTQTHPADGCAGFVITTAETLSEITSDEPAVTILATGFSRAAKGEMPKAPVPAANGALNDAGLDIGTVDVIKTHNPFAVNDLWFSQQTGVPAEKINPYGCSLVYGHPQGPTGARGIVELIHALHKRGGGVGLFTGCAAGDTGAAVLLRVDG